MTTDRLTTLQAIDPAVLAAVVRQDQRSADFEITGWSVERLSDRGMVNPDGLWLFRGAGRDARGQRPWSVVLKILTRPEVEQPPSDLWYWQRELHVARSGLAARLPGPVQAPRFYPSDCQPDTWLWIEHIHDTEPGRWPLANFRFAARELGRWNGAFVLAGPPPDAPWLGRQHYRTWFAELDREWHWQLPLLPPPVSAELQVRWERLRAERDDFFRGLETLPQVFCHADAQRRNLAIRPGAGQAAELVVLDWGSCGLAPLGVEMSMFVFGDLVLGEWPAAAVRELDTAAFGEYIAGLRAAGWAGDTAVVRLAYAAWLALFLGLVTPAALHDLCGPASRDFCLHNFGLAEAELFAHCLGALRYALDCADEARALMRQVGI